MTVAGTISILITRRSDTKKGFEYRVAYTKETEGVTSDPDYPSKEKPLINRNFVLDNFKNSRIVYNELDALSRAKQLMIRNHNPEKGIVKMYFPNINFPAYVRRSRSMTSSLSK